MPYKALLIPAVFALCFCISSAVVHADPEVYQQAVQVTTLLKTDQDAAGRKLAYPTNGQAEVTGVIVDIPPGTRTGWHKHPVPCFAYILEGEVRVDLPDGKTNIVKAGQAFAEVVDLLHNGYNPGPGNVKILFFAAGTKDHPFAVKTEAQRPDDEIPTRLKPMGGP